MAGNLTRDEARERARLLKVASYNVALDLTSGSREFLSDTTIKFHCARPGAATFADLAGARIRRITFNGEDVGAAGYDRAEGRIPLPALAADNELRVIADCAYSRSGQGLHRFTDPADQRVYLHSQFQTCDAHRVYPCFDQPDLKASFALRVTAPDQWTVLSNQAPLLSRQAPLLSGQAPLLSGQAPAGSTVWEFPPTPPLPTYLTAVAAGPYASARQECRLGEAVIPLGLFCRASLAGYLDAAEIFDITGRGLAFYTRVFGRPYPFGKYDQLFVPELNPGAMENAGCVTFRDDYLFRSRVTDAGHESRAGTILHEMAHMWFGDLVTMRWWDDLWLNESFATYLSTLCTAEATRWPGAWASFAARWKDWAYRQDQLPSTHPISADTPDIRSVEVNFDGITYAKGAAVIRQLAAYVGRDEFFAGVRSFLDRHEWGNASLADLLDALEAASGRDLASWSKQWLETASVNTLRPELTVTRSGEITGFAVAQEAPAGHSVLRAHRLTIGLYGPATDGPATDGPATDGPATDGPATDGPATDGPATDGPATDGPAAGRRLTRRTRVELDTDGALTPVPQLDGEPHPGLVIVNDDDLAYAKVRLDDRSLRTLFDGIAGLTDPVPSAVCWAAIWNLCRDGDLAAREYLRLAVSGSRGIGNLPVLHAVLDQAMQAADSYTDPAWRDAGLTMLAAGLAGLLAAAGPGTDSQLAFGQAFAKTARSPRQLALVAALLDGRESIDGLVVDTDLRWRLLLRLAASGAATHQRITAEQERDGTAHGERHAAECRAAMPTAEAKRAAWHRITEGGLSNAMLSATLDGFAGFGMVAAALLAPYQGAYFAELGRIWSGWSSEMAAMFARKAYPAAVPSRQTIARTEAYLTSGDPPPPLRRLLAEAQDEMARALRAQERDKRAATWPAS